jgi:hypothetical protein
MLSAYEVLHYVNFALFGCANFFFTFSHKRHDFREIVTEYKMCVLIFSTACV